MKTTYSRKKKSLTIIYPDGTMSGFVGNIAKRKAKQVKKLIKKNKKTSFHERIK